MRALTDLQATLLAGPVTAPAYLVELHFPTLARHCTRGDVTLSGITWAGGDLSVSGMGDWTTATLRLQATPERAALLVQPDWRGAPCRIHLLPVGDYPLLIVDDYVEEDYALNGPTYADPLLLLDGVLTGGRLGDKALELEVTHRALLRRWTPRLRIAPPVCNHIPAPGTVLTWGTERKTLEARERKS